MCWDCFDDFQDEKDPYCPKCDAELVSDSEDESITKPKIDPSLSKSISMQSTGTQNQNKTSPSSINKSSSTNAAGASSASTTTASTSSINTSGFNYNDLAKVRVIKKNLVYVIGLAPEIANEETLLKKEYFSQYGKITKIVVNTSNAYNPKGPNGPSYSAYITYSSEREASMAILGTEEFSINDRIIRASYGTTKYCSYFLKQQECPNLPDCLYLHSFGKDKEFFQKDECTSNKNIFIDQQKMAIKNIQKYIPDLIKIKNTPLTYTGVLPTPLSVIERLIEQDVLDIKQKPAETSTKNQTKENNDKDDKKKKEDNTPLIDQWSIDFSTPTPPPAAKREESKKIESPAQESLSRKQSQSIGQEKDLNLASQSIPSIQSPQQNKQIPSQADAASTSTSKSKPESEKTTTNNKAQVNGQQTPNHEEKLNSKEEFLMKAINGGLSSPKTSRSSSISQPSNPTTNPTQPQNAVQSTAVGKSQPQSIQNTSSTNTNSNSNLLKVTTTVNTESAKKVEKSPVKEAVVQKQEDNKKEESVDAKKTGNTSANSSNQSSNATSTNHSRTSSINQKTVAAATNGASNSNQAPTSNGNSNKLNNTTSNGNHYEKKETTKKEQPETKYQKHQYVPVSQSNKQTSQSSEPHKEITTQPQTQQTSSATPQPIQVAPKEDTKGKSSTQVQSQAKSSQNAIVNTQTPQQPQVAQSAANKINDENTSSSQLNQQNTPVVPSQQQQGFIHQNHHLQQMQQTQSSDNASDLPSFTHSHLSHHHHTVSEPVAPKYVLQKVEKQEKKLSSDIQIMKKLITRTTQKSSTSRFDFAKNSENCDQPIDELDVINHIFTGQYIILTKSQSQKSNYYDRHDY